MSKSEHTPSYFRPVVGTNIRKIIFGINNSEFSFHVGQVLYKSGLRITNIERHEDARHIWGQVYYIIFASRLNEEESVPWKYVHGVPCIVENFI